MQLIPEANPSRSLFEQPVKYHMPGTGYNGVTKDPMKSFVAHMPSVEGQAFEDFEVGAVFYPCPKYQSSIKLSSLQTEAERLHIAMTTHKDLCREQYEPLLLTLKNGASVTDLTGLDSALFVKADAVIGYAAQLISHLITLGVPQREVLESAGTDFLTTQLGAMAWYLARTQQAMKECFAAKQHLRVARPSTLIVNLKEVYPYPNHSSFPSGHAVYGGVLYGTVKRFFEMDSQMQDAVSAFCKQIGYGRVVAGIHWMADFEYGFKLGQEIATR